MDEWREGAEAAERRRRDNLIERQRQMCWRRDGQAAGTGDEWTSD